MKYSRIVFPFLFILFSCHPQAQKTVDYGYVSSDWTYKNAGIQLEFYLPRNWYFSDANTKKLVKVGSDVKRLGSYTSAFQVPISDFKKGNTATIATLFAITQLDTSSTIVSTAFDYNADKVITLGLIYSENEDVYSFLRNTCSTCNDQVFKEIFLKDVKLGNTSFDGYITGVRDRKNRQVGHFFGVKRFGNLYLVCQYNFSEITGFETYKEYFKGLSVQ